MISFTYKNIIKSVRTKMCVILPIHICHIYMDIPIHIMINKYNAMYDNINTLTATTDGETPH